MPDQMISSKNRTNRYKKEISYPSKYKNNNMDIYTPKVEKKKLPILFWMHGGAYVGG